MTRIMRQHPGVQRLAAAVAGGDLGLPWAVQVEQVLRGDDPATLSELLADSVDAVRSILGLDVHSVAARSSTPQVPVSTRPELVEGPGPDDLGVLTVTLIFDHEVGASITVSRIAAPGLEEARIRVMGNEGVMVADLARPAVLIDGGADLRGYGPAVPSGPQDQAPADAEAVAKVLSAVRRSITENAVIQLGGS